jgi:hypothetical protein
MFYIKTTKDKKLGLERKFEFNLKDKFDLIDNRGDFSTIWTVYDENGEEYVGKLPPFPEDYLNLNPDEFEHFFSDPYYLKKVAISREHENFIGENLFKKNGSTLKTHGAYAIKLTNRDFYLPAFVYEKNKTFQPLKDIHLKPHKIKEIEKEKIKIIKKCNQDGFYSLCIDKYRNKNWLFSETKNKLKIIDFGWWVYQGKFNPYPTLSERQTKIDLPEEIRKILDLSAKKSK